MAYRVEIAKTGRASCQAKHCKDEKVKIAKGELRQGVLVMFQGEYESFMWRHWGCVTPTILHNWAEKAEAQDGNMDLIDGYDELPDELQEKVKRALLQGHVDDEDWDGDVEMNRYNPKNPRQGMFVKRKVEEPKGTDGDEVEASETSPKKTSKKKRAREATQDEDTAQTASKKSRKAKTVKSEAQDDEADHSPKTTKPNTKASRASKVKAEPVEDEDLPAPAKKSRKMKKEADDDAQGPDPKPAPRKASKKAKADPDEAPVAKRKKATKKREGKEASPVEGSDAPEIDESSPTPVPTSKRKSGRGQKSSGKTRE